jgi:hypothetical protein
MNAVTTWIISIGFLLACFTANAQKNLNIETIFQDYGKQEGSILIELGKDILGEHTKINRYKSMIVPSDSVLFHTTLTAIQKDSEGGNILMESLKNGKPETGYYCLKKKANTPDFEYILFTNKSKKITLIYLKGPFSPDQLEEELDKLKDLFIKVNNKRIKL